MIARIPSMPAVTQIATLATRGRAAVAQHFRLLRQAGVLQGEKTGKQLFFWTKRENIARVMQRVLDGVRPEQMAEGPWA